MAIVCQSAGGSDDSTIPDEFEISLWDYPWDEAHDEVGREQKSPATDRHGLSHNVKVLDNGYSSSSVPVAKDDANDSMSNEEWIEISHWVRTGLFTIFEEENSCVSDTSMIQHFCPQLSFRTAADLHDRERRSRLKDSLTSSGDTKSKKNWHLLKLTRKRLWPRKTATKDEATHASLQNAGTVHGMPIYSVLSILNDLEALSAQSDKTDEKFPDDKKEPKSRGAWFRIKKAPIFTSTRKDRLGIEVPPRHNSTEAETSPPSHPKPKRLLYRVRAWNKFRNSRKNPFEHHVPEPVDDKARLSGPAVKSVTTKIVILSDTNLNVTERSDQPAFAEVSKSESTLEVDASEGSVQQLDNPQSYSCGYDMIAFVADTMIDITSIIGGKIEHTCSGGQNKDERWEGSSLVNVGPSECIGELSEVSRNEHTDKIEENDESKYNE